MRGTQDRRHRKADTARLRGHGNLPCKGAQKPHRRYNLICSSIHILNSVLIRVEHSQLVAVVRQAHSSRFVQSLLILVGQSTVYKQQQQEWLKTRRELVRGKERRRGEGQTQGYFKIMLTLVCERSLLLLQSESVSQGGHLSVTEKYEHTFDTLCTLRAVALLLAICV